MFLTSAAAADVAMSRDIIFPYRNTSSKKGRNFYRGGNDKSAAMTQWDLTKSIQREILISESIDEQNNPQS
jgi:hypothetical protein